MLRLDFLSVRLLAEVLGESGPDTEAAKEHFDPAISLLEQCNLAPALALAYAGYGRLRAGLGSVHQVCEYLGRALALSQRPGMLHEPERMRTELASLPAT